MPLTHAMLTPSSSCATGSGRRRWREGTSTRCGAYGPPSAKQCCAGGTERTTRSIEVAAPRLGSSSGP
eukprot:4207558-Lingulodinium_polyedra.AAC.1